MVTDRPFILHAAEMSRTVRPQLWDLFVQDFTRLYDQAKEACLDVDQAMILTAKGRAMALRDIVKALNECRAMAVKIEQKQNQN